MKVFWTNDLRGIFLEAVVLVVAHDKAEAYKLIREKCRDCANPQSLGLEIKIHELQQDKPHAVMIDEGDY